MRILRRRVAAMSPREKRLVLLSFLGILGLALYYFPTFLYASLIIAVCCIVWYYHSGGPLPARLGLNPRAGLNAPGVLRRWLLGWGVTGVSVAARGRKRSSADKAEHREPVGHFRQRPGESGIYRGEALASDSFLFSPRDFLMGSYIGKPESPMAELGRPRAGRNPRELLREKLSRPNHAVYTPNRRLSFAGEPPGQVGRFTITPQRHYPLQQPGASSVGILPPVGWEGFRKKNILSPRNSAAALSPVTVKIARPNHSIPSMDHLSCARLPRAPADPCSRETVLKVLKESRKREVEDEDKSFTIEQKSKRRRNDSEGSAHSAFEPLLPNGTPSQLVPKPGNLKRGMSSLAEESIMKRSRTSSISSGSGAHAPRGTPGTRRNPINSSYSSSLGLSQRKKRSTPSSPLSSPGSSRCQTPVGVPKRAREDDRQSPSAASSVRSEQTASNKAPDTSKLAAVPKVPVTTSSDSTSSGGKRKRKIQLVSSHRDDEISLPPPPELGYSITVKDLDEEKKAAISKIQKVLETPAPEPEKSVAPPTTTSQTTASSTSSTATTTLSSLLAAPLPTVSSAAIPVINLDPSPSSNVSKAAAASNPLLEALKMKASTPASSTPAASATIGSVSTTPVQPSGFNLKTTTAVDSQRPPPAYPSQSSTAGVEQPSAFTQVLSQVMKSPSSIPPVIGPTLFGLTSQSSTLSAPTFSNPITVANAPASSSESVSSTNPLLASGFKPIFAVTTTTSASATSAPESKPPVQSFKPIFGGATAGIGFGQPATLTTTNPISAVSANSTSSIFGVSTSSTTAASSVFPGLTNPLMGTVSTSAITTTTQPATQQSVKSLFGSWATPPTTSTSSATMQAPNTGSTFQFGTATTTAAAAPAPAPAPAPAASAITSSSNGGFGFGTTQPDPQAANQKAFAFGQPAPSQNSTTASFGGFAMASAAPTTATAPTQSTFPFGKASFGPPATQSNFGSSAAQPKPFNFGINTASSTPAPNPAQAPFNFGSAAAPTGTTFGTTAQPAFGASSTGFGFGGSTAPPAAPTAAPSFGAAAQTQSSSSAGFTFGSAAPQPAPSGPSQPAPSGFNFGAAMPCPQFGTPVANNPAPQMGGFNFGAAGAADKSAFGTSTPSFGQSAAAGPIPFGSPGTPVQGFNTVPFGSPAAPSFSIGAGTKPSSGRQRLQARRQHNRKK